MNYVLFHKGLLPKHIEYCINSILSVDKKSKIYLISDDKRDYENIHFINLNELEKPNFIKDFIEHLKANNLTENPLWLTSLERIFYINYMAHQKGLSEFIHFDNDVILYKSFDEIKNYFEKRERGFYITGLNDRNLVFGYAFINSLKSYDLICKEVEKIIINYKFYEFMHNRQKPLNEMRILSIINSENNKLIHELPILPYGNNRLIFDPASYGQYLGGTHQKPKRFFRENFATQDHTIGKEIISKRITVDFKKNEPIINSSLEGESKLVNLHIHSKELEKFVPKNFTKFFTLPTKD